MFKLITIGLSGACTCTQPGVAKAINGEIKKILFPMLRRIALFIRFVNWML